jgi:acylphosphatase
VGFRYTVRHLAKGYDVIGWVRNLRDGRVELLAAGQPEEVDGFLSAIAESELGGFIRNRLVQPAPEAEIIGLSGFLIRP